MTPTKILITFMLFSWCGLAQGTIMKFGFSTDPLADIEFDGVQLSTADDTIGATLGDQNTEVTFLGALSGQLGIIGDNASFSLNGVLIDENPTIIGNTIIQATEGGEFELFDQDNVLLVSGTLGVGILSGPIGGTSTGGFLTTEFGSFTGGSLMPALGNLQQSTLSMSLTNVNGGDGFSTSDTGKLNAFQADATANIGANVVPEPTSAILLLMSIAGLMALRRAV